MKKIKAKPEERKPKTIKQPLNLTPEEAAIFQRIKSEGQRREWEEISEKDVHDYSLSRDPMMLPDFAKELRDTKQFAFRWITRSKERIDEVRSMEIPFKWWLVTADSMPESEPELELGLGCVCKLDQMLVFKPYWMYEKEKRIEEARIEGSSAKGDIASKHGEPIDESGSEYLAGKQYKIGKADEVQFAEIEPELKEGESLTPDKLFQQGDDGLAEIVAED